MSFEIKMDRDLSDYAKLDEVANKQLWWWLSGSLICKMWITKAKKLGGNNTWSPKFSENCDGC